MQLTATLTRPDDRGQCWQWEVPRSSDRLLVDVDQAPQRCLERLQSVDRFTESSVTRFTVQGRYRAAEELLDILWQSVILPLLGQLEGASAVRFRLPGAYVRLPLATARSSATGEAVIHCVEPIVEWTATPLPGGTASTDQGHVLRLDGHFREIAETLSTLRVEPGTTLLLLGCRTAELLPLIARTGTDTAVVTSWDVEDRHCGPFGDEVEALLQLGLSPAAALRSVQARWSSRHPYEWAGYGIVHLTGVETPEKHNG
ncbi:MAG: hypothetical protein ACN4GZ_03305 [Acidimicrobiales bacterium]